MEAYTTCSNITWWLCLEPATYVSNQLLIGRLDCERNFSTPHQPYFKFLSPWILNAGSVQLYHYLEDCKDGELDESSVAKTVNKSRPSLHLESLSSKRKLLLKEQIIRTDWWRWDKKEENFKDWMLSRNCLYSLHEKISRIGCQRGNSGEDCCACIQKSKEEVAK